MYVRESARRSGKGGESDGERERWREGRMRNLLQRDLALSLSLTLSLSSLPNPNTREDVVGGRDRRDRGLEHPCCAAWTDGDERSPLLGSELCDLNHFGVGNGRPPFLRRQRRLPRFEGVCRQQHVYHRQSQRSREDMFRLRCLSM